MIKLSQNKRSGPLGKNSVIAFPKTGEGRGLMMDTPAEVEEEQLKDLHIKKIEKKVKK